MNVRFCLALFLLTVLAACASEPPSAEPIPTVMVLPTHTPTDMPTRTPRPTLTFTLAPSNTPLPLTDTPDLVQTQFASLDATNAAAQSTLAALQTQLVNATSAAPTVGATTSMPPAAPLAIATTAAPTTTLDPVVPMPLTTLYARDVTPLRVCADRTCNALQLLSPGMPLVVNGSLSGDMIENGNNLWYRADFSGQAVYAYSGYLMSAAPTPIQLFQPEVTPPVQSQPPAQNTCPRNCTEAVAWGYSAEQAAACGLDRDGDGVACYGD
jgi:hypothetical protein